MKRSTVLTMLIGAMMIHGTAYAVPQNKAEQKCINSLNKAMAKVSNAQSKASAKCAKTRAKDGTTDFFTCANNSPKVDKAEASTLVVETNACGDTPSIGYTGGNNVNNRSRFQASELAEEILGPNSGITECSADKAGCKCQSVAVKASNKLFKTHLKTFNKCKKVGLKSKTAPFDDDADIEGCVGADPKGKIAKAETKLGNTVGKKCGGVAVPFSQGACATLTGAPLAACLDERVRCHACLTEVLSDGLNVDCDVFDDGDDKNGSCFDDF